MQIRSDHLPAIAGDPGAACSLLGKSWEGVFMMCDQSQLAST